MVWLHTNYPQALHSADGRPNWAALAAPSALSPLKHSDQTTDPARGVVSERERAAAAHEHAHAHTHAGRVNHSNTLMGIKIPITREGLGTGCTIFSTHGGA